jgi:hypothetical protein
MHIFGHRATPYAFVEQDGSITVVPKR